MSMEQMLLLVKIDQVYNMLKRYLLWGGCGIFLMVLTIFFFFFKADCMIPFFLDDNDTGIFLKQQIRAGASYHYYLLLPVFWRDDERNIALATVLMAKNENPNGKYRTEIIKRLEYFDAISVVHEVFFSNLAEISWSDSERQHLISSLRPSIHKDFPVACSATHALCVLGDRAYLLETIMSDETADHRLKRIITKMAGYTVTK